MALKQIFQEKEERYLRGVLVREWALIRAFRVCEMGILLK